MITKPIQIIAVVVTAFFAIVLIAQMRLQKSTAEGQIMIKACEDIMAHQSLRSKEDFDELVSTIYAHTHSYRDESDTILARAVMKVRLLQSEAEFHNEYTPFYHQQFSEILNRLSYLELEDAIYLLHKNQKPKAHLAVNRAHHYLEDALMFSQNPHLTEQHELFEIIKNIDNSEPNERRIKAGLNRIKRLI
ncbi:MAG: hypothetical protein RIC35_14525 [Marinoscillum sp.]